ncbi:hypothetical protein P3X46_004054 [Hevea brasiliensis]|uniref:Glycosyltransferase n=1 Tax=Hevea brasiliensis TaxID=3981 RepID=A0ABQ9MVJ3_HEVBR|nr:UDP-glycosyltransferase 86A1-like [Hevea brasiliensis]KAJ9184319.1 hypothetical protein P3X46_004054 [Hevea brasiliensis]
MEDNQDKPHAIMVPCPFQGHIIPFIHLAIKLASKGYIITFINTEKIHHQITNSSPDHDPKTTQDDIFTEARKSGLEIHYATISDGFPLGFDRSLNDDQFLHGLAHVFSAHVDDLFGKIVNKDSRISCLIADTFFGWPSMIAKKYNLVNVSFWTQPALVFTLYYHMDLLKINGHYDCHDNREDAIDYIPGVEGIKPKDLPSYLQASNTTTIVHGMIHKSVFEDVKKADFVICNAVEELEPKTISALQEKQPFYPIGPTFALNGFTMNTVATSLWSESDCTHWLQAKPHGSVLYVSFGSLACCSREEVAEIAHGLLLSEVSFIWVLRPGIMDSYDNDFLPVGFEDEIKDRGLVVPWSCQISVISHPTVGGFLTHCGWNSVLESIWFNVPMLCYPVFADQITNRKFVVDDWKIGFNLCDRKPISRDEIAEKINRLMSGKSANDLRKNMGQIKEKVEHSISSVGSSEKNFNQFIGDLKVRISNVTR